MNTPEFITQTKEKLKKEFQVTNLHSLPKVVKISVSLRVGRFKEDQKSVEGAREALQVITGQRPLPRHSKKSISSFKLKEGEMVGFLVTLRGKKMWSFLQKLVKVILPSVRDFGGVSPKAIDAQGNLSIGFKDQTPFPEIDPNKIDKLMGLGLSLTTSGLKGKIARRKFYEVLGFVFNSR